MTLFRLPTKGTGTGCVHYDDAAKEPGEVLIGGAASKEKKINQRLSLIHHETVQ